MQIFDVLIDEHSRLERLAHRLESVPPESVVMRRELLESLQSNWVHHARTEEKAFYDSLRLHGDFDDVILDAYAEHNSIEAIMRELEIVNPGDSRFDAKTRSLHYAIAKHFEEEESWIFEAARRHVTDAEAVELAELYFEIKSRLSRGDSLAHLSVGGWLSSSAESKRSSSSR